MTTKKVTYEYNEKNALTASHDCHEKRTITRDMKINWKWTVGTKLIHDISLSFKKVQRNSINTSVRKCTFQEIGLLDENYAPQVPCSATCNIAFNLSKLKVLHFGENYINSDYILGNRNKFTRMVKTRKRNKYALKF